MELQEKGTRFSRMQCVKEANLIHTLYRQAHPALLSKRGAQVGDRKRQGLTD
jgi:hypothetical protein